ncbi:MAG: flavodoxin domain-containing protein [Candidatus Hodarchaeota archaeon]
MKVQIMTHSWYGNGKSLAETLKKEFSNEINVNIADVKDVSPKKIAENVPDIIIIGGAIRMFRGDPKSKKWITELNKILEKSGNKIKYGTGFLTHAMPTDKVNGYVKRYLDKIIKASMIEKVYSELLTARVQSEKGPIYPEEMEKAKVFIKKFVEWSQTQ